ncbi:MAG: D-lyxose/D-mannose family sugar isomerase [Anaerolineales bacterium]|jgi:D-lyxose ketol-isomerase
MKRSEINRIIESGKAFAQECRFFLPPFASWTEQEWLSRGPEAEQIVEYSLGWDVTDFGRGNFRKYGLLLFTIRNGLPGAIQEGVGKVYAEKMLIVEPDQITPFHFHWQKMEDIINRGGGILKIKLYNSTEDEKLDISGDVRVSIDSIWHTFKAGGTASLKPGESITLVPGCYHQFWAEGERVLVGEVSSVNDDQRDNRFLEPMSRFPDVDEDEPPLYLLVSDYHRYFRG